MKTPSQALGWGQFCAPHGPGLPSRLLLASPGGPPSWLPRPLARPTTQQAVRMPSSPAALRHCHGGFCGNLLPSWFPGPPVCPSWSPPGCGPCAPPLAPSPGCSPPALVIEVSRATVVQHPGDWEQAWGCPGATRLTWEQDGCFLLEAQGLEARLQEQTSALALRPVLRPGLVQGVGVGSVCCVGPHRPCPAGSVVVNVWPRGLGAVSTRPRLWYGGGHQPWAAASVGPGQHSRLCGQTGVSARYLPNLWCHGWRACHAWTLVQCLPRLSGHGWLKGIRAGALPPLGILGPFSAQEHTVWAPPRNGTQKGARVTTEAAGGRSARPSSQDCQPLSDSVLSFSAQKPVFPK